MLEQLEELAAKIKADANSERANLVRAIKAYATVLQIKSPKRFEPQYSRYGDTGRSDGSYPPGQDFRCADGPASVLIREPGIAYDGEERLKFYPYEQGLAVDGAGTPWLATVTGKGRYGNFPANPGAYDVRCKVEWTPAPWDDDEITIDMIRQAEATLRKLAGKHLENGEGKGE